jgi:hypothetical protein
MDAGGEPGGTASHQQPKELEPSVLSEGAEGGDRAFLFHRANHKTLIFR